MTQSSTIWLTLTSCPSTLLIRQTIALSLMHPIISSNSEISWVHPGPCCQVAENEATATNIFWTINFGGRTPPILAKSAKKGPENISKYCLVFSGSIWTWYQNSNSKLQYDYAEYFLVFCRIFLSIDQETSVRPGNSDSCVRLTCPV